jgi:hypothetical protein
VYLPKGWYSGTFSAGDAMRLTGADFCVLIDTLRGSLVLNDKLLLFSYTREARNKVLDKLWQILSQQSVTNFESKNREILGGC